MMLTHIARFEARYLLRNPLLWLTAAATFGLFFGGLSAGLELGSEGGLLHNAAYATLRNYVVVSLAFMFVTTSFVANVVIRDDETGFGPIIRSTGITKRDYLIGRFFGAFAIIALCLLLVPLSIWGASLMPWADPATFGPNRLVDHLYGYFLIALPNVLVHSAIFFALATITRSMMATYLGVIGFLSGYIILDKALDRPQLEAIVAIADPFGARALSDAVRYWTVAERNVMLPDFAGDLLFNRLLWIGIAVLCLVLAHSAYRFAQEGTSKRRRKKDAPTQRVPTEVPTISLPSPHYGSAAQRALLWMRTKFEIKQVLLSPAFAILMAWGMFVTLFVLITQRDPDWRPTYPTTLSLIPELEEAFSLIPLIIAIYYAGELVWRERDRRMHHIVDAAPIPNWGYVVPKTLALAFVLMAALLTTVIASACVQLSLGYTDLELGKYVTLYLLPRTWDMVLVATLAIFVQAVSPHKVAGWGIMMLFLIWQQLSLGVDHNLLHYGGTPPVPLSDMNDADAFLKGPWTFRVYWGAFAVLLLVAAHLMWRRGTDIRLQPRLAQVGRRMEDGSGLIAVGALLALVATGGFAYYNTNVLNEYQAPVETEEHWAEYEQKYEKYVELPQPAIAHMTLDIAVYPDERRAVTKGQYRLRNLTAEPIEEVHVRLLDRQDLELTRATLVGARLTVSDTKHGHFIYRLDNAFRPGDERVLEFETLLRPRGFRNGWPNTRLVENGTFLGEVQLAPVIGMIDAGFIEDPATRSKHGLPAAKKLPKLEDTTATAKPSLGRGWATTDITVSTTADQTPIAPGRKILDETRDGRRIARFVSDVPVRSRFAVQSARYEEKHRRHAGIDFSVYYHPAHAWNIDRILDAMVASLDYFRANFGPYQFDHFRIVEFPGYHDLAQAFAGTIAYSETVGFTAVYDKPETFDYVTGMTAHEMAHQYWAYQVAGAHMEGKDVLSETLAQYSAHMVIKKVRGEDQIRHYLQYELDRYLSGRAGASGEEPPLARVAGQNHIAYRKGAVVMYLLQKRMGEDAVNRALRNLVAKWKFKGPPYPRSLDLVEALRAEAKTAEEQELITDLFERVTLYDLRVSRPTAVRRADGKWDVTVPVEAKKFYVEGDGVGDGVESAAPLDERIEIGLFTAEPGLDAFDQKDVILMERRPLRSGRQVLQFVSDKKPAFAGVDPYNFYIDRNSADNVVPLVDPE